MLREKLATVVMTSGRSLGQSLGLELVVETNDHDISISMEQPGSGSRAWDSNLYHSGQLFIEGYANPVKPTIKPTANTEETDEVTTATGNGPEEGEDGVDVGMMPSWRFREQMKQHLVSELVRPESRWQLMMYVLAFVGVLQFVIMILVVYFNGG